MAIQAAITGADLNSLGWLLLIMVALFSVTAYNETGWAIVGLAIIAAGLAAREPRNLRTDAENPMSATFA